MSESPYRRPEVPASEQADQRVRALFDAHIAASARERVEETYAWAYRERRRRRAVLASAAAIALLLGAAFVAAAIGAIERSWLGLLLLATAIAAIFGLVLVNGLALRMPIDPFRKKP